MTDLQTAAAARAAGVAQRSHRPSKRATPEQASAPIFTARMEVADDTATLVRFSGYATVYETPYEMHDTFGPYAEVVSRGAAAASLATPGLDVPLVLGHDQMRRLARTTNGSLRLSEDATGLLVEADLHVADPDVAYVLPKLRSGLYTEMSFAFMITKGSWSPDYTEYRIDAFDLHRGDVAIVGFGANPHTSAGLERATAPSNLAARLLIEAAL